MTLKMFLVSVGVDVVVEAVKTTSFISEIVLAKTPEEVLKTVKREVKEMVLSSMIGVTNLETRRKVREEANDGSFTYDANEVQIEELVSGTTFESIKQRARYDMESGLFSYDKRIKKELKDFMVIAVK